MTHASMHFDFGSVTWSGSVWSGSVWSGLAWSGVFGGI